MAGVYDFVFEQGTTIARLLTWKRSNVPVDLTGYTARMEIRDKYGGNLLYRFDLGQGNLVLGGTAGTIILRVPPSTSAAWTWRAGVYDLEVIDSNGDVARLIQGKVKISPEVTTGA